MDRTAHHPPHSAATRELLRKAGMSMNSELTADEAARLGDAQDALDANPRIAGHKLYRIIRPMRTDEFDV